ncbi:NADH:flavin oxidoreductase [Rhizobium sp. FKL33]|uniref:NADH:flavin oxidoreductase n=1 Tax=Rhizobium sp. FKL33 TaxID=2562307 RepID=UPI0010BFE17A|nr:NADH:flavin oxidoreductase [Rhizobium sp. FKL33]
MTEKTVDTLFRPLTIKGLTLKNRIVMAPMTRTFSPQGLPGQNVADYYRRRAEADVGLILSEGTVVARPASKNHPNIPNFYGDSALVGWKNVIDAVHAAGGRMAPQIWHTGSTIADKDYNPDGIESPSGLLAPGKPRGKAMTDADIADTIAAFAQAAADAKRLGFDTVEIHGAHGYLIDEFFWAGTNERQDKWGGATIAERSRFAVEVTKAVRAAVGAEFPIIFRASQWKQQDFSVRLATTPDELASWLQPLVDAGVDVIHASQRRFWEPEFPEIDGEKGLNFAGWAKKLTGATTISVGSVGLSGEFIAAFGGETSTPASLDNLIERLERDEFDLIAVGRALLNDPQWVTKVRHGQLDALKDFSPAALGELV